MRVVLAPDKWAGTLSAVQAARAMRVGWARAAPADTLVELPVSDGGPGFVDVLSTALGGRRVPATVSDPLGRPVPAAVLVDGATAYVESAAAAGLHLLAPPERDPERTTSYGVGELLRVALDAGARSIVVGLGGSATNDGGAGMLAALGLRVDGPWEEPAGVDAAGLDPRLAGVEVVAATDVDNPLLGPSGAAAVYGPQKGADPAAVARLDLALRRWADALEPAVGRRVRDLPGAGAAGGLGAGLFAFGARPGAGVELVLRTVGMPDRLAAADLVVTGEGAYDATSLRGKAVAGVARAAGEAGLPCLVLAGRVAVGRREAAAHGVQAAFGTV
ncbi:MAG TPA: glycerate kinase, partial [Frankiaceae bacterium]|nr:glycerate kinase [Frankiaceae bacterium]